MPKQASITPNDYSSPDSDGHRRRWLVVALMSFVVAGGWIAIRTFPPFAAFSFTALGGLLVSNPQASAQSAGKDAKTPSDRSSPPMIAAKGEIDVDGGLLKLSPIAYGEVVEIVAKENTHVDANAVLLRINDSVPMLAVQQAEQSLAEARLRYVQSKRAPIDWARNKELLDKQVDGARLALQTAERSYRDMQRNPDQFGQIALKGARDVITGRQTALDAEILRRRGLDYESPDETVALAKIASENAENRLSQAQRQLEQFTLRARVPGRVLKVFVGAGETMGPNAREPALLFCPDAPIIARCEIEQEFASQVEVGAKAIVLDDVSGLKIGEAVVERCADVFTMRRQPVEDARLHNDFRTMECVLKLLSGQERVRIGQHVRVVIGEPPKTLASAALKTAHPPTSADVSDPPAAQ